jgi:hypothetical protein
MSFGRSPPPIITLDRVASGLTNVAGCSLLEVNTSLMLGCAESATGGASINQRGKCHHE